RFFWWALRLRLGCGATAGEDGGCLDRNGEREGAVGRNSIWYAGCRPPISDKGDPQMKKWLVIAGVLFVPACGYAQAAKPCEELKTEIAAKLDAKGVKGYSLDIVAKDADAADGKVVGNCEG